jgi:Yip1 domain
VSISASDNRGRARATDREWWLRALAVVTAPRAVFAALRDDSDESLDARQEPLTAIVYLASIALVMWTPTTGNLLDDRSIDGFVVPVLVFFTAGIYAVFGYFVGGAAVYLGARAAGSAGSYRRARQLLGFALAPVAFSLVILWPIRLALYGGDSFRSGGSDSPDGDRVFNGLQLGFALWGVALLLIGVRAVHGWTWLRSLGAVVAALVALGSLLLVVVLLG